MTAKRVAFAAYAWTMYVLLAPIIFALCLPGAVEVRWHGLGYREARRWARGFVRERVKRGDFRL